MLAEQLKAEHERVPNHRWLRLQGRHALSDVQSAETHQHQDGTHEWIRTTNVRQECQRILWSTLTLEQDGRYSGLPRFS